MKLILELELECTGEAEARSLEATLSPDNASIPRDQLFTMSRNGDLLLFRIESPRPSSASSSMLSLLSDARLFQDVWPATS